MSKEVCDPKYYGKGVHNCGNTIKGLENLLEEEKDNGED